MTRSTWIGIGIAGGVVALVFAVMAAAQPPSGLVHPGTAGGKGRVALGSELFAGNCASCHGSNGQGITTPRPNSGAGGVTGQGPDLRHVGALAPDFYLRTGRMPLSNAREVPERQPSDFSDREIRALVAYIGSLGRGPRIPRPKPARGRLSNGLELYTEHCAGCHQVVGEGGYVTDTKVPVLKHATPRQIAEAVRIGPYVMPRFSQRSISDRELDSIIAYVLASREPNDRGGLGIGHIGPVPEGMVAWAVAGFVLVGVCALMGSRFRS